MNWFILALISVLTTSVANLLQRVLMKDKSADPFAYTIVFQLLCASIIGIYAFWDGFVVPPVYKLFPNLILSGILYAGFNTFLFLSLKTTEVSEVTVLMTTRVIWVLIGSILFLGESITQQKIIGIILVVAGVVFVSLKNASFSLTKDKFYVFLAAFCFGWAFVNDGFILRESEVFSYSSISFFLPGVFILLFKPSSVKKIPSILYGPNLFKMLFLGIIYSIALVTIYLAFQNGGEISKLGPIGLSSTVLTILLAAIFLDEKDSLIKKIISAILVIIGVILLR